MSTQQVV